MVSAWPFDFLRFSHAYYKGSFMYMMPVGARIESHHTSWKSWVVQRLRFGQYRFSVAFRFSKNLPRVVQIRFNVPDASGRLSVHNRGQWPRPSFPFSPSSLTASKETLWTRKHYLKTILTSFLYLNRKLNHNFPFSMNYLTLYLKQTLDA